MATVFVTGGTGLIGSNICEQLRARGDRVRALARPGSEIGPLKALGVEIVDGDISDAASVLRASKGCESVIHSAAVLGGVTQDPNEHLRVNTGGVGNVLDAARTHGMRKVVTLGTTTYFDFKTRPLTETSPVDPDASSDPYTQTKRAAYLEAMKRAEAGLDVSVVIPGGTFGPAPCSHRAMEAPSFNLRLLHALEGKLTQATAFPIPWSYATDVAAASVAALDRGMRGETYLAFASNDDVCTLGEFLNRGCRLAGVDHRVVDITGEMLDASPELRALVGPSMVALAHQKFPEPYFDNERTRKQLGFSPKRLDDALAETVAWLRRHHWL
jgi:nucleoside-diphosphate-sugar epimerase